MRIEPGFKIAECGDKHLIREYNNYLALEAANTIKIGQYARMLILEGLTSKEILEMVRNKFKAN